MCIRIKMRPNPSASRQLTKLTVLGQTECVQVSFNVQDDGKLCTAANLNDRRSTIIDTGRLQYCLGCIVADAALATLVVTACIYNACVCQKQGMIAATCSLDNIHMIQIGNQCWRLVRFQLRQSQLAELIATETHRLAIHVDENAVRRTASADNQTILKVYEKI